MTAIDQENLRRTQAERRIAMQGGESSGGAGWLIGIVVVVAIIAGIVMFGGGDGTDAGVAPAAETAAPAVEESAPAAPVTE